MLATAVLLGTNRPTAERVRALAGLPGPVRVIVTTPGAEDTVTKMRQARPDLRLEVVRS